MQNKPPQGQSTQMVKMGQTKTINTKLKKEHKIKWDWRDYFSFNGRLMLIIPYVIGAAIFIITPMVMLLTKSVEHHDGIDAQAIIKESTTWNKIGMSILLGIIAAGISLCIAFPFSFVVARSQSKVFRIISISLLISPMLVFTVARIFSLKILLIKMYDGDAVAMQNKISMIIGMVYLYMPFMIIPLYSVLQSMPKSLFEASRDLGYNSFSTVFRVVVPYSLKAVFSGVAVVFMMSSTTLVISQSLVGGQPNLKMIGNEIDRIAVNMRQNPVAATQGSILALVTIAVVMAVYGGIYLFPIIVRKLRGGVNV